jgi:hypothetical protein
VPPVLGCCREDGEHGDACCGNLEGGWDIREPGTARPVDHCADIDEAVRKAGTMMLHGGAVRIDNQEGFLVETRPVRAPGDNPWWYRPQGPLLWVLGVGFVLQGEFGMLGRLGNGLLFWMYLVMGLFGIAYIVLMLISLRRDRRLTQSLD